MKNYYNRKKQIAITKRIHKTIAIFILFASSLFRLSTINATTIFAASDGVLSASPQTVTEYTNNTGNTLISWNTSGVTNVLLFLNVNDGNRVLVASNVNLNTDKLIEFIQAGNKYTFSLYSALEGVLSLSNF